MDRPVFVQRLFELDGEPLGCFIFAPFQAPGGEFRCDFAILWPGKEIHSYTCGIDGMQALLLTMKTIHTRLLDSEEYKAGGLTWLETDDLGFPESWSLE